MYYSFKLVGPENARFVQDNTMGWKPFWSGILIKGQEISEGIAMSLISKRPTKKVSGPASKKWSKK